MPITQSILQLPNVGFVWYKTVFVDKLINFVIFANFRLVFKFETHMACFLLFVF